MNQVPSTSMSSPRVRGRVWPLLRIAVATLTAAALITQLGYELEKAARSAGGVGFTVVGNFVGTFTYLSSAVMVGVLFVSSLNALRGREESARLSTWFVSGSANVVFVGIFYNLALRSTMPSDSIAWINETVHVVLPIYALLDAVFGRHTRLPWRAAWGSGLLGAGWTALTQLRGPHITNLVTGGEGWYPYEFVDPTLAPGGLPGAIAVSVILTGLIVGIGGILVALSRAMNRPSSAAPMLLSAESPPTHRG